MYYVYILKSVSKDSFIYIGFTSDLKRRLDEHNNGLVKSTICYKPLKLVYYEAYRSKKDAVKRERNLKKHANSLTHLKNRIFNSLHES